MPLDLVKINTSIAIKGCDVTSNRVVAWSGRKAEVFEIDATTQRCTAVSEFDTAAVDIAIGKAEKPTEVSAPSDEALGMNKWMLIHRLCRPPISIWRLMVGSRW